MLDSGAHLCICRQLAVIQVDTGVVANARRGPEVGNIGIGGACLEGVCHVRIYHNVEAMCDGRQFWPTAEAQLVRDMCCIAASRRGIAYMHRLPIIIQTLSTSWRRTTSTAYLLAAAYGGWRRA